MNDPASTAARVRRLHYIAAVAVLNLAVMGVGAAIPGTGAASSLSSLAIRCALLWLIYCQMVQRLHDQGSDHKVATATITGIVASSVMTAIARDLDPTPGSPVGFLGMALLGLSIAGGVVIAFGRPERTTNQFGPDPRITDRTGEDGIEDVRTHRGDSSSD